MLGFPLRLPLETTTPREIALCEVSAEIIGQGFPTVLHDHFVQLRLEVKPNEVAALRSWLEHRNRGIEPEARSNAG